MAMLVQGFAPITLSLEKTLLALKSLSPKNKFFVSFNLFYSCNLDDDNEVGVHASLNFEEPPLLSPPIVAGSVAGTVAIPDDITTIFLASVDQKRLTTLRPLSLFHTGSKTLRLCLIV